MNPLRKAARGRQCTMRLPGICNHNPETVVLAHIRRVGVAGVGQKPPDVCGVWVCSACHDVMDGRVQRPDGMTHSDLDAWTLDALLRTLATLSQEGLISVARNK